MAAYSTYTDQELLTFLKEGSEAAFTEIYKRYWDKVYAVACHRLNDETEAEEVVQDVFFSFWKRREILEVKNSLNTYLAVAVKYQVINRQTRKYYKTIEMDAMSQLEDSGVDSTQLWFSERELKQQLDDAISKLPEKCRVVFRMSRYEDKTNAEIAKKLGVTEKNVEAHITRALSSLRKSLEVSLPFILYLLKK
jgi:RNA polymerase sigma-70 factor (family 1)